MRVNSDDVYNGIRNLLLYCRHFINLSVFNPHALLSPVNTGGAKVLTSPLTCPGSQC